MKEFLKLMFGLLFDVKASSTDIAATDTASIDAAIPEYWAKGIMEDSTEQEFWAMLSGGEKSMMPVIDKTGQLRNNGDQLTINTIGQLMGAGVTGESTLQGNEEVLAVGSFTVTADVVRHAVGVNWKADKQSNFNTGVVTRTLLGEWMSRKRDDDIFFLILDETTEDIYANGQASISALSTQNEIFGKQEIDTIRLSLIKKGAKPISMTKVNGRKKPIFGLVLDQVEEHYLMQDTNILQSMREALPRDEKNNPLFKGALGMYNNMLIYSYYSTLQYPAGSALRPETIVFATLTTTATTLTVGGATPTTGSSPDFTKYFASSGSLQIEDEVISYTGKTANTFTGLTRGEASTTAAQHTPDNLVTQRNVATVIGFGAQAIMRANGDMPTRISQEDDYGFVKGLGIQAYYGQSLAKSKRFNRAYGIVNMKVYSPNPNGSSSKL